jgi:hypothetical protein
VGESKRGLWGRKRDKERLMEGREGKEGRGRGARSGGCKVRVGKKVDGGTEGAGEGKGG